MKKLLRRPNITLSAFARDSLRPHRPARKTVKRAFLSLVCLLLFLIATSTVTFLRHRQLCSYQELANRGSITTGTSVDLCPNLLSQASWGSVLANTTNFNILQELSVNPDYKDIDLINSKYTCSDQLNPLCWISGSKPELKQSDGFTNLLLVGLDTRPKVRLQNTDTMMLVSYHHASGEIMFLSFPRDLYVRYTRPNGYKVELRLNAVYANYGDEGLNSVISQITGRPVHYYAYVDLTLFSRIIDELGGVDITLAEDFRDRYPRVELPPGEECKRPSFFIQGYYCLFEFKKGTYHFDSFDALVYTRSRILSSDYSRAKRQQNLMRSVLSNVLHNDKPLIERAALYLDLYKLFQEDVLTNIQLEDIAGMLAIADQISDKAVQVVADPSLDSGRLVYTYGILDGVGWVIMFRDKTYAKFQAFIRQIWDNLPYYIEQPKIVVQYAKGAPIDPNSSIGKFIGSKPQFTQVITTEANVDVTGVRIYQTGTRDTEGSLRETQKRIPGSLIHNAQIDDVIQTDQQEDILIIVGKDAEEE